MQAIVTKFVGPTTHRGSRVVAKADAGRRVYSWHDDLGIEDNHRAAALAFAHEFGWLDGPYYTNITSGSIDGASRYAHILIA